MPSAQKPVAHSVLLMQLAPIPMKPQAPLTQLVLKQSASLVHVVLHVPVGASQAYGAHIRGGSGMIGHVPLPSHVTRWPGMFPVHWGAKHTVPADSGAHRPTLPARAQLWQLPSQAVVQHTPFAQKPLRQSIPSTHLCPIVPGPVARPPSG